MTSSALMPVRYMNGNWILRRKKLNSSPEFLMNENIATNPRRSLLHQKVVLHVRSLIDRFWMLYLDPNLRTRTIKNLVSPFGDLPSSPPTRLAREHSPGLKPPAETGTLLPITGPIPVNRDSAVGTKNPKVLSPLAPLTRKVGEAEAVRAANRKEQLPVGGKIVHFRDSWTKLFPQHPEIVRKVSQGILIAFDDVLPSLLRYLLELPSNNKTADLHHAVQKLPTFAGHREGDGHYVAGLLQPPVSSPETRWILPSNHRLKEVKSIHHSSLFQNGDTLLHYSSPSTTGMDHQNRSKGRVPSHSGPRQHPQILPVRSSRDSLSIPCSSVWALDGSKGIHQDSRSCGPAVTLSGNPGPCVLGRLDHTCKFSRTESGTYTTHYSTSTIIGLDNQLGQINVTTLTNPGLSGFTFQPRTSPYFPSGLVLTNSHQCPIPSISVDGHDCSKSFIHHQQDVTFCPIHIQRPSSPTVSTVLVQSPVVSTSAVVGYTNPIGYGLPHIPALASQTNSDDRRSVTSSGTQPVLLHGCISQGMGRQLEGQ